MKAKFILILSLFISIFSLNFAQDMDNYWILEDFSSFDNTGDWIDQPTEYLTYPNNTKITTNAANVEPAEFCAYQTNKNLFRIRGLAGNGYLQFTVPNAGTVKIYVSGKADNQDRVVCIYRNDLLVQTYENVDRTVCHAFVDKINSQEPVTYKITGGVVDSPNPITVFYVEASKYGAETNKGQEKYWINEDFMTFDNSGNWITGETNYASHPNNINITTTYANVEPAGDCASANALGNQMRIGGLSRSGSLQFTVPNAGVVKIHVTGKSTMEDRTVRIYRNNVLVKTYENLDKNVCRTFIDEIFSSSEVTYKVTAGDENSDIPFAVYHIEVEKYYTKPDPELYEGYWIHEDFSTYPIETGYSTGYYESFPNNIKLNSVFSNVEWGENCTAFEKNLRISGRVGEDGNVEFTVPDFSKVRIGITGKSTSKDRTVLIYKDGELVETFSNLDREVCQEFAIDAVSKNPTTFKIAGGENAGSPVALSYVYIQKADHVSNRNPESNSTISIFPNPTADIVYLRTPDQKPAEYVTVCDLSGRQLLLLKNDNKINVSQLEKGIYILKTKVNEEIISKKLVKK